jgi:hypothetical protein
VWLGALVASREAMARRVVVPAEIPVTPERVARWLLDEVRRRGGFLSERTAALEIVRLFDGSFTRMKDDGSFAVGTSVLKALHRVAGRRVGWDRSARGWRLPGTKRPAALLAVEGTGSSV